MTIFQASDLSKKRKEVLEAARKDHALIRDTQGEGLVMLPAQRVKGLEKFNIWSVNLTRLRRLQHGRARSSVVDWGDLAWLLPLDDDDLSEFCEELSDTLLICSAEEDYAQLDSMIHDWKVTAGQLADPLRRHTLLTDRLEDADFTPVDEPQAPISGGVDD